MSRRGQSVAVVADHAFVDTHIKETDPFDELSAEQEEELEARLRYWHLVPTIKEEVDLLLRGHVNYSQLPNLPPKTVRLFVSSTNTDFVLEKEALIKETFPELRAYCRQSHGIDLQVIDPRWGQAEKSYPYHGSLELYSRELCRSTSSYHGPHQLVLLGDKLGAPAPPWRIPAPLYQAALTQLQDEGQDTSLLDKWYKEDMNALPDGEHVLQPVHTILGPTWEEREWLKEQRQIRSVLNMAAQLALAKDLINEDELQQLCGDPVLLEEIRRGLTIYQSRMLCIRRKFKDIAHNAGSSSAPLFTDLLPSSNHMDPNSTNQRNQLTEQLAEYLEEEELLVESEITWSEPCGMNPNQSSHANHINDICKFVYQKTKQLIDESVVEYKNCITDRLYEENIKHWTRAAELTKCVYDREDILGMIEDYVVSKTNLPLVISGKCGQGKSTVLGVAAQSVLPWLQKEGHTLSVTIVTRFCGHTERSSDIRPLLEDICHQISYSTGSSIRHLPKEYKNQTTHIRNILQSGNFRGLLVLILDGLDQLEPVDVVARLDWLPFSLPNNVKIILSTSTQNNPRLLTCLRNRYPQSEAIYELEQMNIEQSIGLLIDLLKQRDRRLTDIQLATIFSLLREDVTPLDVEAIASLASRISSSDTIAGAGTAQTCLSHTLDIVENKYPHVFVTHALMYLTITDGLSESELCDVLSLDDDVLECLCIVDPTIRRFPVVYWTRLFGDIKDYFAIKQLHSADIVYWRHTVFKSVVEQRYCDKNELAYITTILTDYYKGRGSYVANPTVPRCSSAHGTTVRQLPLQPNMFGENHQTRWQQCHDANTKENIYNERRQHLLPHCLIKSSQIGELYNDVLFNFRWMQAKLKSQSVYAVLRDYEGISGCWEVRLVYGALKMSEVALKDDPDQLSTQLLSRLLQFYHKNESIRKLLYDADLLGNALCSYVPNWQSYHSPGAVLEYCHHIDLSEYSSQTGSSDVKLHTIALETKDKFYLLCKKASSPKIFTWDISNAFESLTYTAVKGKAVYPTPCGQLINCFTDRGTLRLYNTHSSQLVYEVPYGKSGMYPSHVALSPRYTAFVLPGVPGPHIVDITAGTELRKLTYQCGALAFTSNSRMLAVHNGSTVIVIEMPLMTRKCVADLQAIPSKLLFADDQSKIYALTGQREVKVIHINYTYKQCTVEQLHCGNVDMHNILLSHANDMLLISALYSMVLIHLGSSKSRFHIKDMPDGPFEDQVKPFNCSGFSSDDVYVVAGRGRYVAVWNTKGRPLRLLSYTASTVSSMFLSKYTNKLLTLHENKTMQMWNLDNLRGDTDFNNRTSDGQVELVANTPAGTKFITVATDTSAAVVYNAATNVVELTLQHDVGVEILSVAISQDGLLGITVAGNTDKPAFVDEAWSMTRDTKLWDLQTGQCIYCITNNTYTVLSPYDSKVVFCPCLEYDLSQPTFKVYNLVIASVHQTQVDTQLVELPEGAILETPVFIHSGRYLCLILCDGAYKTQLCLYSFEGRWKGIKYMDVEHILGSNAVPGDEIISLKNISDDQLLVVIGKQVGKVKFDQNGCLDHSEPVSKCAVLYNVHSGTKVTMNDFLIPEFRLDLATYSIDAGVYFLESDLWCAKTGTLWKTSKDMSPLQGQCCLLMGRKYLAVVTKSGSSVVIYRTSNMEKQTKINLQGQIKQISAAVDEKTLAVTCTDTRICLFTLTLAASDAMIDVIAKLPSRQSDVIPTRLEPGRHGVTSGQITSISWRDMMTQSKINEFQKLTANDIIDGNGIKAFLA